MSEVVDKKKSTVIIAPHCDDEIIGAYEVLIKKENLIIIYSGDIEPDRREKVLKLKEKINNIKIQLFQNSIPQPFLSKVNEFFAPDPIYEIHPKHREWGAIGENMARQGFNVTFYNTNMNAPYIHEVNKPEDKRYLLEEVYPDQKSLWEYDHKYFLFEGYCKWIF